MKDRYDVIIAGTGTAGLYAALNLDPMLSVLLISKNDLTLSNSALAQGGVAAVINKESDTYKSHIADTLIAGGYKNDLSALEVLVTEGPSDVLRLEELGVNFDMDKEGNLQMTLEGGHSKRRIVHHKDSTGAAIVDGLLLKVKERPNIDIYDHTIMYSLEKDNGGDGFYAGLLRGGEYYRPFAGYVILATGGIGRVYQYTTNSAIATGDGITLAHMLGAPNKNLSYIQFHPTAFAGEKGRERFLISEAVRGEGAYLLNAAGERFVQNYDPRGELAPRDVVSKIILKEAARQGSEEFYLDITYKDSEFLKQRFPMIYERCLEEGVDITKDRIPIYPCQHYLMGGIDVDTKGRTSISGLYAAGECSHTGVHGKNRLASNSLLEALVFSRRAAVDITLNISTNGRPKPSDIPPAPQRTQGQPLPEGIRTKIRAIMQESYFVNPDIEKASKGLREIEKILNDLLSKSYAVNEHFVEARSLATVASIILREVVSNAAS